MDKVVILQRVVPHYRVPLFEALYREFGWTVACADAPPGKQFMENVYGRPFQRHFRFRFLHPDHPTWALVPLGEILRQTGAQTVIAEAALGMSSTYELLVRRRLTGRPRVVLWSHGVHMGRTTALGGAILRQIRGSIAALADAHLCYSEEGRAFLSRFLPPSRLFVANNTLDVTALRAGAGKVDGVMAPGSPSLISVGRLVPTHNVRMLVRVFRQFRKVYPDAVLTIVGDGPDIDAVRAEAGDMVGTAVIVTGAVYDEDRLARLYLAADAMVTCGDAGLSVNHALAYGIPVVLFERTEKGPFHSPEAAFVVNGVTGLRVAPYTETAMVCALVHLFRSAARLDMSERIRRYVDETLTLERMIDGFRQLREFLGTSESKG